MSTGRGPGSWGSGARSYGSVRTVDGCGSSDSVCFGVYYRLPWPGTPRSAATECLK